MMLPLMLALLVPALACAEPAAPWPDTLVVRLEALALIETLNAEILASRSATFTLEKWCADHRLSGDAEPKIVARQGNDKAKPATLEQRQRKSRGLVGDDAPTQLTSLDLGKHCVSSGKQPRALTDCRGIVFEKGITQRVEIRTILGDAKARAQ